MRPWLPKVVVAALALSAGGAAAPARGAVVFDARGFEPPQYAGGKLVGQQTWSMRTMTPDTARVQGDVCRSGEGAVRLTSAITNNAFFPPVNFVPRMGETVVVECDIARTVGGTPSFGYLIDVYGLDGARVARAGLGRDGMNIRAVRTTATGTSAANGVVYGSGQWVHFELRLDFGAHTWGLEIDGAPSGGPMPMLSVFSDGMSHADLQVATFNSSADAGYFDNYVVRTVPVPATGIGVVVGVVVMGGRRRRAGAGRMI